MQQRVLHQSVSHRLDMPRIERVPIDVHAIRSLAHARIPDVPLPPWSRARVLPAVPVVTVASCMQGRRRPEFAGAALGNPEPMEMHDVVFDDRYETVEGHFERDRD